MHLNPETDPYTLANLGHQQPHRPRHTRTTIHVRRVPVLPALEHAAVGAIRHEVAELLAIPIGTVKSRTAAGLAKLRAAMHDSGGPR